MKFKWRFHPDWHAVGENERFYTDMAASGWHLASRGIYLSRFTRREPVRELYRVELGGELPEEQLDLYADSGWEFVTRGGSVNVFRAPEGSVFPELYTTPQEQALTVKRVLRREFGSLLIVLPILIPLLIIADVEGGGAKAVGYGVVNKLVEATSYALFMITMLFIGVYMLLDEMIGTTRLYHRLRRGIPLDHAPKRRRLTHIRIFFALTAFFLLLTLTQLLTTRKAEMPERSDGAYITLSELGFDGERRGWYGEEKSTVTVSHSLLADITETRETLAYGAGHVRLEQTVYDLRVPALAEAFARSVVYDSPFTRWLLEMERLEVPGWDSVGTSANMVCIAVRGGRVVYLELFGLYGEDGKPPARDVFPKILELLQDRP